MTTSSLTKSTASQILPNDILKSPYNFGFLTLTNDYVEQELERGLVGNLEKLILELGQGFAYIGRQYHMEIAGDDYFLDMLFYHIKLRCFCVVELKTTDFKVVHSARGDLTTQSNGFRLLLDLTSFLYKKN